MKINQFLIVLITFVFLSNNIYSQNSKTISFGLGYNYELTDAFSGIYPISKKRDFGNFLSVHIIYRNNKKWWGFNSDFNYINDTYKTFYIPSFYLPESIKGKILKTGINIYPLENKIFSLSINFGVNYTDLNNRLIYSYKYIVQTEELLSTTYVNKEIKGIGFYYGIAVSFKLYKNFSVMTNFLFYDGKPLNIITSGVSIFYNICK